MAKFKIIQEIDACIGCGACSVIAPDKWEMGDDGKSILLNAKKKDGKYEKVFDESELEEYQEAAESCPVEALHIKNLDTGEDIV